MPSSITSHEVRLATRPRGRPSPDNFRLVPTQVPEPAEGQALVRNLFMSVDPYMRGRMNDRKSYVPPYAVDQPLEGSAVGEVVTSHAAGLKPGDTVVSNFGWREYFVAEAKDLHPVSRDLQPLSIYLGTLGLTGMTAWAGLQVAAIKTGDVIFISGAAGAVGNVAGQLAKIQGCRVIGTAGSPEKVQWLRDELGFDAAFNYKDAPIAEQLAKAAPDGIDVYFDNVGGDALSAALDALHVHGRIVVCGGISDYNEEKPRPGPSNFHNVVAQRLTLRGFLVRDWLHRRLEFENEVGGYYRAGKLHHRETVVQGLDHAVEAFLGLFEGRNIGKMVVKLT